MNKKLLKNFQMVVIAGAIVSPLPAQAAATLIDAIKYGKFSGQLRYRFENVDQEAFAQEADASTLRTQLGYTTDNYLGFTAFLQVENVSDIGNDLYNSTANGKTRFPVVADPVGTELNQYWLSYETPYSTTLKYGRQGINLDNQRFIGTVNFRQNDQTFDSSSIINTSLPDTTLTYAHISRVNRINGANNPNTLLAVTRMNSDIFNATYKGFSFGTLTAYAYLLDFVNTPAPSHKDFGLRFDGAHRFGGRKVVYTAEYATQSDYRDGASTNDADYLSLALGTDISGVQIKLNYELLGGDGTYGFQAPLGTLHAFDGWADRFLATPGDGIKDIFISAGKTIYGVNLFAAYHDFSSDNLDYDYGTEWDLSAAKKVNKYLTLKTEYASYDADRNTLNVTRNTGPRAIQTRNVNILWLTADFQF